FHRPSPTNCCARRGMVVGHAGLTMRDRRLTSMEVSPMGTQQLALNAVRQPREKSGYINTSVRQRQRSRDLYQQRRQLAALSDFMLKDIGLSRADAEREANHSFWDDGPLER